MKKNIMPMLILIIVFLSTLLILCLVDKEQQNYAITIFNSCLLGNII